MVLAGVLAGCGGSSGAGEQTGTTAKPPPPQAARDACDQIDAVVTELGSVRKPAEQRAAVQMVEQLVTMGHRSTDRGLIEVVDRTVQPKLSRLESAGPTEVSERATELASALGAYRDRCRSLQVPTAPGSSTRGSLLTACAHAGAMPRAGADATDAQLTVIGRRIAAMLVSVRTAQQPQLERQINALAADFKAEGPGTRPFASLFGKVVDPAAVSKQIGVVVDTCNSLGIPAIGAFAPKV
jgi:hypothetical protein